MRIPLILSIILFSTAAVADWPMYRHDAQRTAASTGVARLGSPVQAWSWYLGGQLSESRLTTVDVDGDGQRELLFISGGKLQARRPDDSLLWETQLLELRRIIAVEDLNGDGELDIVAVGLPGLVAIFGVRDGRLEWRTATDTFGPGIGAVRLGRFNGDALPDLYVADNACGSIQNKGDIAWAYSFGAGFGSGVEDTATRLWQLERGRDYNCGANDVVADFTQDGRDDVVTFSTGQAWIYDGTTGRKISSGKDAHPTYGAYALGFSVPYGQLYSDVIDVDADGQPEIVGYTNNNHAEAINSRRVFVLGFDPKRATQERLYVRWSRSVPSVVTDTHLYVHNGAVDLDRDGQAEVVSSFEVFGSGPTTYVYRGSTGEVLASLPGTTVAGVYDLGADQPRTLVVSRGPHLEGYRFSAFPKPDGVVPAFTLTNAEVVPWLDLARQRRGSAVLAQASLPEQDGVHRALLVRAGSALQLWDVKGATAERLASLDLGDSTSMVVAPQQDVARQGPGLLLARSDGHLLVLDRDLRGLNLGTAEEPLPGVRMGGYYAGGCGPLGRPLAAPVAARYDRAGDSLFVVDSNRSLVRLDATGASRVRPPSVDWKWPGAFYPLLMDANGDGMRDVLAVTDTREPGALRTLTARHADGVTPIWSTTIPEKATETVWGDVVPLAGATGGMRFAAQTKDSATGNGRTYGFTVRGDRAFASAPILTAGSGQGQLAAFDVDGDARDDLLINMGPPLKAYSGVSGAQLANGPGTYPVMPIVVKGRAGNLDVIGAASHFQLDGLAFEATGATPPYRAVSRWNFPTATYAPASFTQCFGAVVQCPTGLRFANPRAASANLVVADAATGAISYDVTLFKGRTYASEAEARAVGFPGVLGNVTAVKSLDGAGTPAFLVGSSDGYLYALDACSAAPSVLWAMNFRSPVGEPILADTDGDDEDEIVVTVADGYVYGIDGERFPAPAFAYDVMPSDDGSGMDVAQVRGDALAVRWAEVTGATGYEWALYTAEGTPVTSRLGDETNPFIPVDAGVLRATVPAARLRDGARYSFAVRALGPEGARSVETLSNGVRFLLEQPDAGTGQPDAGVPDAGNSGSQPPDTSVPPPAGGCGCTAPGGVAGMTWLAALLLGLKVRRRARG